MEVPAYIDLTKDCIAIIGHHDASEGVKEHFEH
jgi:hypothetical protein